MLDYFSLEVKGHILLPQTLPETQTSGGEKSEASFFHFSNQLLYLNTWRNEDSPDKLTNESLSPATPASMAFLV